MLEACWSNEQGFWLRLTSVCGVSPCCLVQRSRIEHKGLRLDFPDTQIMILSTLRVAWTTSTQEGRGRGDAYVQLFRSISEVALGPDQTAALIRSLLNRGSSK